MVFNFYQMDNAFFPTLQMYKNNIVNLLFLEKNQGWRNFSTAALKAAEFLLAMK